MSDQGQVLRDIFRAGRAFYQETGLGRWHRCPCCPSPGLGQHDPPVGLHVLPTAAGDLVFRCHRCGWSQDSVEFVCRTGYVPDVPGAADFLSSCAHLSVQSPAAQLDGYQRLAQLRNLFEEGRQRFAASLVPGARRPVLFGDWALLATAWVRALFSNHRFNANLPTDCWARISVDVFGRWSALHLHHPRHCHLIYRLELRDWEVAATTAFFLSPGSEFLSWDNGVLCEESNVALALERGLRGWESHQRWPIVLLERCTAPLAEPELPFWYLFAVVRGNRTGRFALPFCTETRRSSAERVRLRRVPEDVFRGDAPKMITDPFLFRDLATAPEYLPALADQIVAEQSRQPLSVVVADALGHPGVHPQTRHRLLREVSARTGVSPGALVEEGLNPWTGGPYALNAAGGTTYVAQEGRYWRRGSREREFTAVTNFQLRLVEDRVDTKGRVTHHASLEIAEKQIAVSFSTAVLESPKRLLTLITKAARGADADYPVVSDPKAKRLLPELVKATQARPPRIVRAEVRSSTKSKTAVLT